MNNMSLWTRRFTLSVLAQAVVLFLMFNVIYLVAQPLSDPHLTLYNRLVPGRLRLFYTGSRASYSNETLLPRLVADHAILRPKAEDEYRIIVLGASETWGSRLDVADTEPLVLDSMGLRIPDGRVARFYNLGYVHGDSFKDLLILQTALDMNVQPDMVILNFTPTALNPSRERHWLLEDNADFASEVIERYGITDGIDEKIAELQNDTPAWLRNSFIGQREHIATWLNNQVGSLWWWALQDTTLEEEVFTSEASRRVARTTHRNVEFGMGRASVIRAFAQVSEDYDLPIVIVETPIDAIPPSGPSEFEEMTRELGIPHLNCQLLLPPSEFTDIWLHMTVAGNEVFASEVAEFLQAWWEDPTPRHANCPNNREET